VRTWEGATERRVRVVALAAAWVGRKEVERESVMADASRAVASADVSVLLPLLIASLMLSSGPAAVRLGWAPDSSV
jgi:hypothetical protein